jgi:hypothetical protein
MDESRRLAMRRAHVKHKGFCSCGRIVSGNGGQHSHSAMHERKGDGHRFLVEDIWREQFEGKPRPQRRTP